LRKIDEIPEIRYRWHCYS